MVGQSVSHYRIVEKLGGGGMGVVYKAEDTRLNRTVALKFLPEDWSLDLERRRRFIQEARAASALDHPNIVTLYDVAESEGRTFIVMQFVPGKTLRELIGHLKLREALGYAIQIAEGLAAAHAHGIIHRDLKPENVIVAGNDVVKILDFGLAKLTEPAAPVASEAPTQGRENLVTEEGCILGTPSYMSPEQAPGKKVDSRTDIFSFGSILYEMLTGKRAFPGTTFAETAASILEREPDWNAIPESAPPPLLRLLKRSLRKNVEERLHDVADAGLELKEMLADVSTGTGAAPVREGKRSRVAVFAAFGIIVLGVLGFLLYRFQSPTGPAEGRQPRFQLTLPRGVGIPMLGNGPSVLAISPNGQQVVFVGENAEGRAIFVRDRHELDAQRLPGTEGAWCPFFSPDGRWVAYRSDESGRSEIRVRPYPGPGPPRLVSTDGGNSPLWSRDGKEIFFLNKGRLMSAAVRAG